MDTKKKKKKISPYMVFSTIVIILLAIAFAFPLYWILTGSFKTQISINSTTPEWWPSEWVMTNYDKLFSRQKSPLWEFAVPFSSRFSADGKNAHILSELSNEIKVYRYDGSGVNPELELLQSVSSLSNKHDKDAIHNAASGLALAPDGKHLFCTTAGENTVSMYEIDAETGLLEKKFTLPISGDYPKDLVIFPDNQHIAVLLLKTNTL